MTRRVYGELSVEDYQRVLETVEKRKSSIERNGSATDVQSETTVEKPGPCKPGVWSRLKQGPKIFVVALLVLSTYAAGATWRWGGKWSEHLLMEQLASAAEDATLPADRRAVLTARISERIADGLDALAVLARGDSPIRPHAIKQIEVALEQARDLLSSLR